MADFSKCLQYALDMLEFKHPLKDEQIASLHNIFNLVDTISILPTGFGKSVIFQLLPCLMQLKYGCDEPMIVFVVAPLNSIMENQVQSLSLKAIKACYISFDGSAALKFKAGEEFGESGDEDGGSSGEEGFDDGSAAERFHHLSAITVSPSYFNENDRGGIQTAVKIEDLQNGRYHLIYAHPESLRSRTMLKLMRSKLYKERVCAVVVDEVHMISEWGEDFRPAFKQLGDMTCLFPTAGHLALTATCTKPKVKELTTILQYRNPNIVSVNPDRPNIYIEIRKRLPNIHKYEKLDELIQPLAKELGDQLCTFPVTIVYMENLEAVGYCYQFVNDFLKDKQYDGEKTPENRIFAQYHKDYTSRMKSHIVSELSKQNPKLRLVLATVALGMGLNAPSITRIIHSRPPTTLEAYMQEIGRAGRSGQPAQAILYYNNSDIAKSRKGLSEEVIKYCRNDSTCLRLNLVQYLGFDKVMFSGDKKDCCSNCKKVTDSQTEQQ